MNEEKQEVKGTIWLWTVIGLIAGGWIGMVIAGYVGGAVGAIAIGISAYRSSKKSNGGPPSWLWRSKKK